jgi:hypothetical protein
MDTERKVDVLAVMDAAAETCERYHHKASAAALPKARAAVAELIEASRRLVVSVSDETEALRTFKGSDGEGMAACKIAESRVVECTELLRATLSRLGASA